jgi:hypothetical protein
VIDFNTTFSLNGLSSGGGTTDTTFVPQFAGNDEILRQNLIPFFRPEARFHSNWFRSQDPPTFLIGGFNRSLANMFRNDAPNYSVGLTISFPL